MATQFAPPPENYATLLKDETYYDVGITVGKDSDNKLFHAHKLVLENRVPYFTKLFSVDENNNNKNLSITLPFISPKIFEIILNYLYTGRLDLELKTSDMFEILVAAGKLGCQEIVPPLQDFLIQSKSSWMKRHFNLILQMSSENNFSKLQEFCDDFIERAPELIFQLSDFNSLPETVVMSLVNKEDILLEEEVIWDHVLNWALAKLPQLPVKPDDWTSDDKSQVKSILEKFLPFIRFSQLNSQQYYEKAHPYLKILRDQLDEELLKYYLVPNTCSPIPPRMHEVTVSSIINNSHHFAHVLSYISKLINNEMMYHRELDFNQRVHYYPYEPKLLLRGSRHGFSPKMFHKLCDDKPGTVTLIKVKDKDEILGGYNSGEWKRMNGYGNCKSFIFSMKDNFEDICISHVDYNERALNYGINYGPSFGLSDLIISGENFKYGRCYCKMDDYKVHIRNSENDFSIEEYEVFQIVNKR